MTFEAWLKKQRKRNDPVGDLADDFFNAKKYGHVFGIEFNKFEKCNEEHLCKWNAPIDAFEALKQAQLEYNNYLDNNK